MADRVKVTVSMAKGHLDAIRRIGRARGCTVSEVLRHAIHLGEALHNAIENGGRIIVEHPEHGDVEVIMPPIVGLRRQGNGESSHRKGQGGQPVL